MKKRKTKKLENLPLIVLVFFLVAVAIGLLFFKISISNKTISDVTELPENIKESLKNLKPQKAFHVPILLYHYVEYVKDEGDTIRKSLNITPYVFDQEIKTMKDAGYNFVTLKDLADALDDKIELPAKSVILTFDDGYRDFYTDVFPILKKYQVKAVAFIVYDFLDKPNNLTTWQLKEISNSKLVEIGAHTMNHVYLKDLPLKRVEYEITESKKYLERLLSINIVSFAYPYGAFNDQAIRIVKEAGFRIATTTIDGNVAFDGNRYFLYRVRPGGRIGESLLELLAKKNFKK